MPERRRCRSLHRLGVKGVADLVLQGCQNIDSKTDPFKNTLTDSPTKPIISPSRDIVDITLTDDQRQLKEWIGNLPDTVVEEVVTVALANLEAQLIIDKDKKLIMTLINIETVKLNDFLFGMDSLLRILRGFHLLNLNISNRLWCILYEYEDIFHSKQLRDTVVEALPHLPCLVSLNLAYLAEDRMMPVIGKYLKQLVSLDLSHSLVTDRGLRLLAGSNSNHRSRMAPSPNVIRSLASLLDMPLSPVCPQQPSLHLTENVPDVTGLRLEHLTVQSCTCVTETGVRFVLQNYRNLRTLVYHQRKSVFEILITWSTDLPVNHIKEHSIKLEQLEHGFPYGISPFSEQLNRLLLLCPHLTSLNLVTDDHVLPHLIGFSQLTCLTVELEDCVGDGFIAFIKEKGEKIRELTVSCSTDPETALDTVEGGQQGHLFNLVVLATATLCPKVTKLSVSGCGLVSAGAVESVHLLTRLNSTAWIRKNAHTWFRHLEVLMLMSYEESLPSMSIHSVLLKHILKTLPQIQVLSLEGNFGTFFTDEYLKSILQDNMFPQLRILDISVHDQGGVPGRIPLSLVSVEALLHRCRRLAELRISDWNLSNDEAARIQQQVIDNNWNLSLTRKLREIVL